MHAGLSEVVRHMTQLEPDSRDDMHAYLHEWPGVFPDFFEPMHGLLSPLMVWAKDHSVLLIKAAFSPFFARLREEAGGVCDLGGAGVEAEGNPDVATVPGGGVPGSNAADEGAHGEEKDMKGDVGSPGVGERSQATAGESAGGDRAARAGEAAPAATASTDGPDHASAGGTARAGEAGSGAPGGAATSEGGAATAGVAAALGDRRHPDSRAGESAVLGGGAAERRGGGDAGGDGGQGRLVPGEGGVAVGSPSGGSGSAFPVAAALGRPQAGPGPQEEGLLTVAAKRAREVACAATLFADEAGQPRWLRPALTLLACVLCAGLRGAATMEARWECVQMLVEVRLSMPVSHDGVTAVPLRGACCVAPHVPTSSAQIVWSAVWYMMAGG